MLIGRVLLTTFLIAKFCYAANINSENDLIRSLINSQTQKQRKALLTANAELYTEKLADLLSKEADRIRAEGETKKALEIYELLNELADQLNLPIYKVRALYGIGKANQSLSDYPAAKVNYQKGLAISNEINDASGSAFCLVGIGDLEHLEGNYAPAEQAYEKAIELAKNAGDRSTEARAIVGLGKVSRAQSNIEASRAYYLKALEITEAILDNDGSGRAIQALGNLAFDESDYKDAADYYKKAISLYEKAGTRTRIADCLVNISMSHMHLGNLREAADYGRKALKEFEAAGDKSGVAYVYVQFAENYRMQGAHLQAISYHKKALKLRTEVGEKGEIARSMHMIGDIYLSIGEIDRAGYFIQESMKIWEKTGYQLGVAKCLDDIGMIYQAQNKMSVALDYLTRSMVMYTELNSRSNLATIYNEVAEILFLQGDNTKALEKIHQSVELAREIEMPEPLWSALTLEGKIYRRLDQTDKAIASWKDAIEQIEFLRSERIGEEQEITNFFQDKLTAYHELVSLFIEQRNFDEAFRYAERAKARTILDSFEMASEASMAKAMSKSETQKHKQLIHKIQSLNLSIREKKAHGQDSLEYEDFEKQLDGARREYEAFRADFFVKHPEFIVHQPELPFLNEAQLSYLLPSPDRAILEFVLTPQKSFVFVIRSASDSNVEIKAVELPFSREKLSKDVEAFRQQLSKRSLQYETYARNLHDSLLASVLDQLPGVTELILIPDHELWSLPFQALLSKTNRFLIEDYTVSYAPSVNVLWRMSQEKRNELEKEHSILALGNPFSSASQTQQVKESFRFEISPLLEAEREVNELRQIYGNDRSSVHTGKSATEILFKKESGQYDILHLATHGIVNDGNPMYSQLVLSVDEGETEDGLLETWEILDLKLKSRLVVLSACETSRGKISPGEGVVGLAWAFFIAGASETVVSQWKVDSRSTTELMVQFHKGIVQNNLHTAKSLRQSMLHVLQNKSYRHPFYWGPFIVIGYHPN